MRAIIALALAAPLFSISLARGEDKIQTAREARAECGAYSQAEMAVCLKKKAEDSAARLQAAEAKARGDLSHWDEDEKYIRAAQAKLASANRSFARYRDDECAFYYARGGGAIGNALDIQRYACLYELNARRAAQLGDLLSDLRKKPE